jgi:hypothetical protein
MFNSERQMRIVKVIMLHESLDVFSSSNPQQDAEYLSAFLCDFICINRDLLSAEDRSEKPIKVVVVVVFEVGSQKAHIENLGLLVAGWIDQTGLATVAYPVKEVLIFGIFVRPWM